ncbi:TIGR03364 family FAD-dependent oxidoreductase [Psychrobacter sp. FDAARGOS_221]|nr:TIGR03364 family FAD-dependent oxidoreductase [Psychrobacter sp. FDAARGOS_221]
MVMNKKLSDKKYDVVVVGGGIVGLASAYAAVKKGLSVAVVERHSQNKDASVRNFGFVTVSGQRRGEHWQRAMHSRNVWAEVAPKAGIQVEHSGLHMLMQRPEAMDVAEAFLKTEMGEDCKLLTQSEIDDVAPYLKKGQGVFYSPHELRVESHSAIGKLAHWLKEAQGVDFYNQTSVTSIELPNVYTSRGVLSAEHCVVCPGTDYSSLYPDLLATTKARMCTLNMMRVKPKQAFTLNAAVMSDLSFARYDGFAQLPEADALKNLLDDIQSEERQAGVHLIVVQSEDGSLIIGDSHDYSDRELPFRDTRIDDLILNEFYQVMDIGDVDITQHWLGVYPSADDVVFKASPEAGVVVGSVTGGTGASTGFAFGEELIEMVLESK